MEPIYVQSNQHQRSTSQHIAGDSAGDSGGDANAYTLTLSQTSLPDRADEIASVVARSPIDRFEHPFHFDTANDYLAWSIATDAQRKAGHLGYDPALAGIEAYVIGPATTYGRLDDFFTNQPPMTPTRLIVYKQNRVAGSTPIQEHLGPEHRDRFVGGSSLEQSAHSSGRALLTDLVKAYAKKQVYPALDETRHPYGHSLGFRQRGHLHGSPHGPTGLGTLELDQLAKVKLSEGYDLDDFYADAHAVKAMMQDLAAKAHTEAQGRDFDNASQAYGFAAELQSLYRHLCSGRHTEALGSMNAISPYMLDDLPHRLYEHLETQAKLPASASPTTQDAASRASMRYTRVDLEGRVNHYASMTRKRDSDTIEVEVLCPDVVERTHYVQAGADCREDQQSMAKGLQQMLDGYKGNEHAVSEYYDAVIRLAD